MSKKFFRMRVMKHLEQVFKRGNGGLIPGSIQGQVGWSSEQRGLVEDVPAHCRGAGLDIPSNVNHSMVLRFYDSVIL